MPDLICTLHLEAPAFTGNVLLNLAQPYVANQVIYDYLAQGEFPEADVVHFMQAVLRPGDIFVDGGANIGYHTCIGAALVGKHGQVWAFEPHDENRRWLAGNLELNDFHNCRLSGQALSDETSTRLFYESDQDTGHCSFGKFDAPTTKKVWTTRLDELFVVSRLLKLDIEGAEHLALQGATRLLVSNIPPFIICELNPPALERLGSSIPALRSYMRRFNYHTWLLPLAGGLPQLVPPGSVLHPRKLNFNALFASLTSVSEVWPDVLGGEFSPAELDNLRRNGLIKVEKVG